MLFWAAHCHLPAAWLSSTFPFMAEAFPTALKCNGNGGNNMQHCKLHLASADGDLPGLMQNKKLRA